MSFHPYKVLLTVICLMQVTKLVDMEQALVTLFNNGVAPGESHFRATRSLPVYSLPLKHFGVFVFVIDLVSIF